MDTFLIRHQRKIFNTGNVENERSTIGEIFVDGKYFCYVLEDEVRADGQKVFGKTAIPAIEYDVTISYSNKFKRDMILLYNKKDFTIEHEGVTFSGVRVHGGNDAEDSHGCPIVAYNTDSVKVWGTSEKDILAIVKKAIKEGKKVKWLVEVKPFNNGLDNQMLN
jgi:hypothetical protein